MFTHTFSIRRNVCKYKYTDSQEMYTYTNTQINSIVKRMYAHLWFVFLKKHLHRIYLYVDTHKNAHFVFIKTHLYTLIVFILTNMCTCKRTYNFISYIHICKENFHSVEIEIHTHTFMYICLCMPTKCFKILKYVIDNFRLQKVSFF